MIGTSQLINTFSRPCFTDTTDIFKDGSGVALYGLDYDASDAGGASGKFGEAAIFNGSSSYIELPSLGLSTTSDNTVSFWVYPETQTNTSPTLLSLWTDLDLEVRLSSSLEVQAVYRSGNSWGSKSSGLNLNSNQWNFVSVSYEYSVGFEFFVNSSTATQSFTGTIDNSSGNSKIGTYANFTNGYFKGSIDQVRIFNTALTQSQVTQLYQENSSTVGTHLFGCIANYNLDGSAKESMGTTAYDGTETDITYRYDGTPTAVDFGVGGKSNYGARFNGSSSKITLSSTISGIKTYSFWINPNSSGNATYARRLFGDVGGTSYTNSITFDKPNSKVTYYENTTARSSATISDDAWSHIAFTSDGTTLKVYTNGSLSNTYTTSGFVSSINEICSTSSNRQFKGSIDQVRIFSKALSSAEVGKLYGNGAGEIACAYTSTTDNVAYPIANTAYYKLDNNSKDSARSTGKFNEGAVFNGSSSYISGTVGATTTTSFSMWIKINNTSSSQFIQVFDNNNFAIFIYNGKLNIQYASGSNSNGVAWTISNASNWNHIAGTFTSSSSTLYVNGVQKAESMSNWVNAESVPYIGNRNALDGYFDGEIDQVRIYNTALDSTDVSNLYAETVSDTSTLSFPSGKTAIATYQLDGNSTDLSGNYNGTDTNITYAYDGTESNIEYRFGRFGQAAVFNGSSSGINLNSVNLGTTYTISAWFNWDGVDNNQNSTIVGSSDENPSIIHNKYSTLNSISYDYSGGAQVLLSNIDANTWYHVAIVQNGTSFEGFINGISVVTATTPTLTATIEGIGYDPNQSRWFSGKIDQVRMYSSALTSSQVTELYNEKPEVDTSNFKAVLYNGTSAEQYISNVGMDLETNGGLVWMKSRDNTYNPTLYDSVRGTGTSKAIYSNEVVAENTYPTINNFVSFDANGFTVGATSHANNIINKTGDNLVAWCWKGGGLLNKSASFNGSSSKIVLPNTSLGITDASNFSISYWFNTNSVTQDNQSVIWANGSNAGARFGSGINSSSQGGDTSVYFGVGTSSFTYVNSGTSAFTANTWVHVVCVKSSTTGMSLYVDNVLKATNTGATGAASSTATADNRIGGYKTTAESSWFNGSIDQVRVFNKAISASEVTALYNETASTINTLQVLGDTSCVAAYPLGVGAGDIGNTYSGTPTNVTFNNPGHLTRNNSGTIESTVSANTEAGFSIVKYTTQASGTGTVGHGLDNPPEIVIVKTTGVSDSWRMYHSSLGAGYQIYLNLGNSAGPTANQWNNTAPTPSVFSLGTDNAGNYASIAYCFHSVTGYSKIGSYSGTGVSGKEVALDFNPSFVLIKRTNASTGWIIVDDKRGTKELYPNLSNAEDTTTTGVVLGTNKFTLNTTGSWYNASGGVYLYMAFK